MSETPERILWPYRSDLPQRFNSNFARYRARGGTACPTEDVKGFVSRGDVGDITRFLSFTLAFDQIAKEGISGDVAELGVYRGLTAHALATFARRLGRHTYLFDTFTGFDQSDFTGVDRGVVPGFSDTSIESVRELVGTDATTYCVGHFPGTIAFIPPDTTFSLVHLDCDLYAPMLSALEFFYPRMQPGGFILIHDYSSLAWEGAERAADLFFSSKPECLVPMPDGCGTAIVRRERPVTGLTWQEKLIATAYSTEWLPAGSRAADPAFLAGWSGAEAWGRWGVGDEHICVLCVEPADRNDLVVELDLHAMLLGVQTTQTVDVSIEGTAISAVFEFSTMENRGIRTLSVPASAWIGKTHLRLAFRPEFCKSPAELVPTENDDRPLGIAVHRLRIRNDAFAGSPS